MANQTWTEMTGETQEQFERRVYGETVDEALRGEQEAHIRWLKNGIARALASKTQAGYTAAEQMKKQLRVAEEKRERMG